MAHKQAEIEDENIPKSIGSDEKEIFLGCIQIARDKLDEAVTKRLEISVARSLSNESIQEINKAIAIYSTYMADDSDEPVQRFVDSIAIVSAVARSILSAFVAYSDNKKSVNEVAAVISKVIPILDKLLDD